MAILIYRRRVTGPVFSATTRNDKAMYLLLAATIVAGLSTTVLGDLLGHPYDYRPTMRRTSAASSTPIRTSA